MIQWLGRGPSTRRLENIAKAGCVRMPAYGIAPMATRSKAGVIAAEEMRGDEARGSAEAGVDGQQSAAMASAPKAATTHTTPRS